MMMMMLVRRLLLLHRVVIRGMEVVELVEQAALGEQVAHRQASVAVEAVAERGRPVSEAEVVVEGEVEVDF